MTRCRLLALFLIFATVGIPASAAVRAWVDNPQVPAGEPVRLSLAHDGQTNSRPDLAPLKQDFDILGTSTSTSVQIANGSASSVTQLDLTLAPKHSGQLTIPPLTWDTDKSPAIALSVGTNAGSSNNSGAAGAATSGGKVFLETEADPKSPYVQAAVHLTVRVYAGVPLSHGDLELPDTDAATVRQVGSDAIGNVVRNGQPYQVITRHYVIFPQHSGHLTIPGPTLSGEIPDRLRGLGLPDPFSAMFGNSGFGGMMGLRKPIRLHGDSIALDVQPRPASAGASYWLPARNVSLQAVWNPSQLQTHVGDPVTLDLKLKADGLTAAQLPDLSALLKLPSQLKAYPDQPKLQDDPQGNDLSGSREQSIALIADEPGNFTIPELRLTWWDTRANQTREAILPAQTLTVDPAPGAGGPVQAPAQTQQSTAAAPAPAANRNTGSTSSVPTPTSDPAWKWASLIFGLLWIGTLAAWLSTRKRGGPDGPAAPASGSTAEATSMRARPLRAAFLAACRNNDAPEARRNLLLWANAQRPGDPIRGLNALAKLTDNPELTRELQSLDRACYAGASWDGTPLAALLAELPLPAPLPISPPNGRNRELAPLYR